jgi:hypothetical protein
MSPVCLSFGCIKVVDSQAEVSWSRFVLEKLTVAYLFELTAFNGTFGFSAVFRWESHDPLDCIL